MPNHDMSSSEYLPVREMQMRWGLYVTGAGTGVFSEGAQYPPPNHPSLYRFHWETGRTLPEYQIIYISQGCGEFRSREMGDVEVAPGSVILLFPDVWHTYRPSGATGWCEHWVSINGAFLYNLQEHGIISPERAILRIEGREALERAFATLVDAVRRSPAQNSFRISAMAVDVLALSLEGASAPASCEFESDCSTEDPLVRQALELIWNWSYRKLTVQDVAQSLSLNRRTLERHFYRSLGRTVLEEITQCRLERASRFLRETLLPIKQIAYSMGYTTPERMSKVFQRSMGMSPTEYRKKCRQA